MTTARKQFGRRGLDEGPSRGMARPQSSYSGSAAVASPAIAAPTDDDSFSILKVLGFAFGMLFSFQGRLGRMEYWSIGIARFIIFILAIVGFVSTFPPTAGDVESVDIMRNLVSTPGGLVFLALFIALTICLFSLEVRRLHDRDASGFWVLILFIPIVGGLYGLWLFIANGFFPGTPGTNRFDTARSQASVFD